MSTQKQATDKAVAQNQDSGVDTAVQTADKVYATLDGKEGKWDAVVENVNGKLRLIRIGDLLLRNGAGVAVSDGMRWTLGEATVTIGGVAFTTNRGDGKTMGRVIVDGQTVTVRHGTSKVKTKTPIIISNAQLCSDKGIEDSAEIIALKEDASVIALEMQDLIAKMDVIDKALEEAYGRLLSRDKDMQSANALDIATLEQLLKDKRKALQEANHKRG